MKAKSFGCSLSVETFEKLEAERGMIPRSTFIGGVLDAYFATEDELPCDYGDVQPSDELMEWAKVFSVEHRDSIDYFIKFGSSVERALAKATLELAETGTISPD